jgi:hypothetical protein
VHPGVAVDAVRRDASTADRSAHDLTVLRPAWDYPARRDAFVAWTRIVPRPADPAGIAEGNTDKHHQREPAGAGIPITPALVFRRSAPPEHQAWYAGTTRYVAFH